MHDVLATNLYKALKFIEKKNNNNQLQLLILQYNVYKHMHELKMYPTFIMILYKK